ncbi:leucine-rich repeat-containing G-protein coupled receptor 6 [Trichonephila clavipes]|nr:leucine-rich repeat-containing G-protein coupled receptor 6 [Trichonephila clavipes]
MVQMFDIPDNKRSNKRHSAVIQNRLEGRGSRVVKITDSWLACPEFEPGTAEDPPIFSNNLITELSDTAFRKNPKLTLLEMGGNPITKVGGSTFSHLPNLKKLRVSEARQMEHFPDLTGTSALEMLTLDRANLKHIPEDLCEKVPLLKRMILRSNKISVLPNLQECKELRQIYLETIYQSCTQITLKSSRMTMSPATGTKSFVTSLRSIPVSSCE